MEVIRRQREVEVEVTRGAGNLTPSSTVARGGCLICFPAALSIVAFINLRCFKCVFVPGKSRSRKRVGMLGARIWVEVDNRANR